MTAHLKSLALAAALSALAGAAAQAHPVGLSGIAVPTVVGDRQIESEQVSYADLDLGSAAGMKTLMTRINSAAKDVCGPAPEYRESRTPYEACIKSAADQDVIEVARAAGANPLAMNALRQHGG